MTRQASHRLESVAINNFRSIAGAISIPLNASTVLIHGLNGSGKTSVLSAIELALTGGVDALEKADPNYKKHLRYLESGSAEIYLEMTDQDGDFKSTKVRIEDSAVSVTPLLSRQLSRFFTERCYLAQSTLGRLLDIYQHTETRDSESALTRFVKELLSLDQLDALIDGLFAAGDLRRVRNLVLAFSTAEDRYDQIQSEISTARLALAEVRTQEKQLFDSLVKSATDFIGSQTPFPAQDIEKLRSQLTEDQSQELSQLTRTRRELVAMREEWDSLPIKDIEARRAIEEERDLAERAASTWKMKVGQTLELLIENLRTEFPNLPSSVVNDPEFARTSVLKTVTEEVGRCSRELEQDDKGTKRIVELNRQVAEARARTGSLDGEIAKVAQDPTSLSAALAAILPHIHGTECPVCQRDFAEISTDSLSTRVSSQIAKLTTDSGVLERLLRERSQSESLVRGLSREVETLKSQGLSDDGRSSLGKRINRLSTAISALTTLAINTREGVAILRRASLSENRLVGTVRHAQRAANIRNRLEGLSETFGQSKPEGVDKISSTIERLETLLQNLEARVIERQQLRRRALAELDQLEQLRARLRDYDKSLQVQVRELNRLGAALDTARGHRAYAKKLAEAARNVRANIVRRVFDQSLNGIWRQLFIRLAPDEDFVPAFVIPIDTTGPVVAELETIHRTGVRGGTPTVMLSAGNLNVAALTLFLALHLSVEPKLPWLIFDDPVQSMDEVHVSQFAALLRTLTRDQARQLIVSVHERPLFEYLRLELSPAFQGEKLITIELGQSEDGATTAATQILEYQPDRALATA